MFVARGSNRVIGCSAEANESLVQDDPVDTLGIGSREEEADRSALRHAEQRCPLAADRLHHGTDVVHPLLETRHAGDPIREPIAAFVEDDDARESGQAVEELAVAGKLVEELDVRDEPRDEHQVAGTLTDHLVRDADVTAQSVAGFGKHDRP